MVPTLAPPPAPRLTWIASPPAFFLLRYSEEDIIDFSSIKPSYLVPIRIEFETEKHRIRDCFMWNVNGKSTKFLRFDYPPRGGGGTTTNF